jgi:hypothetical protein
MNPQLYDAARKHASDMVEGGYFSHMSKSGPERDDAHQERRLRQRRHGLAGRGEHRLGSGAYSTPTTIVPVVDELARTRANILRRADREAGLAIAVGAPAQSGLAAGTCGVDPGGQVRPGITSMLAAPVTLGLLGVQLAR